MAILETILVLLAGALLLTLIARPFDVPSAVLLALGDSEQVPI